MTRRDDPMRPGDREVGSLRVYRTVRWLFGRLFARCGGFRVLHGERVPASGGFVVASVHLSHLDPPALALAMPKRRLLALGKEELWHNRAFGWLVSKIGAFPIRRGEGDAGAIRQAISLVNEGHPLLVFPEGTRGDGERLLPLQPGPAMIARKTGCPVLPCGISGTEKLMPAGGKFRRQNVPVVICCGEPMRWADYEGFGRDARARFQAELQAQLLQLTAEAGLRLEPPVSAASESQKRLHGDREDSVANVAPHSERRDDSPLRPEG